MSTPSGPAWLTDDRAEFVQGGVSISLASRDAALRPSLGKGLGCRVLAGGELRLYVDASHSQALLRDVGDCARLAAVFSDIASHRTLQVKASDARLVAMEAEDHEVADAHARRYGAAIVALGFPGEMVAGFLDSAREDRVAIACRPAEAFEQTPGPQAGTRIGSGT